MLHKHLDVCTAVKHVGTEQEKQYTWPANTGKWVHYGISTTEPVARHVLKNSTYHTRSCSTCERLMAADAPWEIEDCFRSQRWVWAPQTTRWLKRSTTGSFHGSKLLDHVSHQTGTMVRRISWATTSILQSTLCHSWMNLPLCALPA